MIKTDSKKKISPFLRWTGSKRWFVNKFLESFLPKEFNNYHEPFLGGGAVFFFLKDKYKYSNKEYSLSDSNADLINCYSQIQENPELVINHLKKMKNSSKFYYDIRKIKPRSKEKMAARFIYLNKTSFNGIYRVNSKGNYNVPYGNRKNVDFINESKLIQTSKILKNVKIFEQNFEDVISSIQTNDLIFIDPPYTVAHENNGFIEYNQKLFSWEDQIALMKFIKKIDEKGAYFILTNAKHKSILDLYKDLGEISTISRYSQIGGKSSTRGIFNEVVICNTI